MTAVTAPLAGEVRAMDTVPDPVFAQGIVGPGVAVEPADTDVCQVVAPISGTLVKVKPHAFVVAGADGGGVLVHLGIDTVKLAGAEFEVIADEGAEIAAGEVVTVWNPQSVRDRGLAAIVPVVAVDTDPSRVVDRLADGTAVVPGDALFTIS